eukprot:gb/GFBE01062188.1/.p1 GENE.gb/GFBE01062188.1/~~gb/GFBE01062188.1/.p1  ORF type:complete len:163 (+),score=17.30 gb/GFBE01062188.1/:1-489(+)
MAGGASPSLALAMAERGVPRRGPHTPASYDDPAAPSSLGVGQGPASNSLSLLSRAREDAMVFTAGAVETRGAGFVEDRWVGPESAGDIGGIGRSQPSGIQRQMCVPVQKQDMFEGLKKVPMIVLGGEDEDPPVRQEAIIPGNAQYQRIVGKRFDQLRCIYWA